MVFNKEQQERLRIISSEIKAIAQKGRDKLKQNVNLRPFNLPSVLTQHFKDLYKYHSNDQTKTDKKYPYQEISEGAATIIWLDGVAWNIDQVLESKLVGD